MFKIPKHKFHAKKTEVDEIRFDSKKEAKRFGELKLLQRAGEVLFFLSQVPFRLSGKTVYRLDFLVFWKDGEISFEDVKGYRTETYKLKKRQVEELYPIKITEI